MRKRLYEIIELSQDNDRVSSIYDILMMFAIIISIIPLAFKQTYTFFYCTDIATAVLFIIDYILRLITADYKMTRSRYHHLSDTLSHYWRSSTLFQYFLR